MAIRSVKFKLFIPRSKDGEAVRQSLWRTHKLFNEGVRYYMERLLWMKGEPFKDCEEPSRLLLRSIREVQKSRDGFADRGSDEQVVQLFRDFYACLLDGDSQALTNQILGPLTNPKSQGMQGVLIKSNVASWVEKRESGVPWQEECLQWARDEGTKQAKMTGRKPKWAKLFEAWLVKLQEDYTTFEGEPEWIAEYIKKSGDYKLALAEGIEGIAHALRGFGILPGLFDSFTKKNLTREDARLDKATLKYAIAQLQSWESWNKRVKDTWGKLQARLAAFKTDHFDPVPKWQECLMLYESARREELNRTSLASDRPYRLGEREIRNWDYLREDWIQLITRKPKASFDDLWEVAVRHQARLQGSFGDPHFYKWLARPENRSVWAEDDPNRIHLHVLYNELQSRFEDAKSEATLTFPDPISHPKWTEWEAEGGSNLLNYRMRQEDGSWHVEIPLVSPEGQIENFAFLVAPSVQRDEIFLGKRSEIVFEDHETKASFSGKLGALHLQFSRSFLEGHSEGDLGAGNIGPVYVNISLDLEPKSEWRSLPQAKAFRVRKKKPSDVGSVPVIDFKEDVLSSLHLSRATKGVEGLSAGLRVMSVDLGLRSLAACSVFEIRGAKPENGWFLEVKGNAPPLFACHERSFLLRLTGEEPGKKSEELRQSLREKRMDLRAAVRRLSELCSLAGRSAEERESYLQALVKHESISEESRKARVDEILPPSILDGLQQKITLSDQEWTIEVLKLHRVWEKRLGDAISAWRREGRDRSRRPELRQPFHMKGISFWNIEELMEVRRLLNSWSAHAREPGEIVRAKSLEQFRKDEKARGVDTDRRLLEHINNLKEDRLKKGADAILMAALGYVYLSRETRWEARYAPCQLILFEDLTRYRFRSDRPRRENSQLMRWGHREMPRTVAMQGELYGIRIGEVGAEFTSRFHAESSAPGVRARIVNIEELEFERFRQRLLEMEIDPKEVGAGGIIPWEGGELFVTLHRDGHPMILQADLNAAQNLQKRFWRRYENPVRLSCFAMHNTSGTFYLPKSIGKRLEQALGFGKLVPFDEHDKMPICRWEPLSPGQFKKLAGQQRDVEEPELEEHEFAGVLEEAAERTGKVITFFNDPSGIFFPKERWYPAKLFWHQVRQKIVEALREQGKLGLERGAVAASSP